jgi:hypothetical protein
MSRSAYPQAQLAVIPENGNGTYGRINSDNGF